MAKTVWICYFVAALICQLLFHDFPEAFFAFPVNAAFVLLLGAGLWIASREKKLAAFFTIMASPSTTLVLLPLFLLSCLLLGFTSTGIVSTWWFTALLTALFAHLFSVLLRGMSHTLRRNRFRFFLIHAGLLLVMTGGFIGAPDTHEWRAMVGKERYTQEAADKEGGKVLLDRKLTLIHAHEGFSRSGMPTDYSAELRTDKGEKISLKVNHPHRMSWIDDLYISGIIPAGNDGGKEYCIVQWIRQPWKYVEQAGIWMLIAGSVMLFAQGASRKKGDTKYGDME